VKDPAAVVDANVAIKWLVDEPDSGPARSLATATLEAPDLLPIECASVLWKKAAIGDLTRREAAARLEFLLHAPVTLTASRELLDAALELAFTTASTSPSRSAGTSPSSRPTGDWPLPRANRRRARCG
jgi:predicted nucleic acid-binding protein